MEMLQEIFPIIWLGILALLSVFIFFYLLHFVEVSGASQLDHDKWSFSILENMTMSGHQKDRKILAGKRAGELAFLLTMLIAAGAYVSSLIFYILAHTILLLSCLAPLVTLFFLHKIPQKDKHPDDIVEPRLSFLLPTLCIYSLFMLNTLSSSLGLPTSSYSALGFMSRWDLFHRIDLSQTNSGLLLSCMISLFFIFASAIHMISYCCNKILQSAVYLNPRSSALKKFYRYSRFASPRSIWPSIVLAIASLLFSSGFMVLRLPLVVEYLIR